MKKFINGKEINEENLVEMIKESMAENWENAGNVSTWRAIDMEIIATKQYEGRQDDVREILQSLEELASDDHPMELCHVAGILQFEDEWNFDKSDFLALPNAEMVESKEDFQTIAKNKGIKISRVIDRGEIDHDIHWIGDVHMFEYIYISEKLNKEVYMYEFAITARIFDGVGYVQFNSEKEIYHKKRLLYFWKKKKIEKWEEEYNG